MVQTMVLIMTRLVPLMLIIITRKCTLWRCKSTPTPKESCCGWRNTMGQLLYEVSRKYHLTFSFDSVLCNWVNYSHRITYVLTPGAFRHNFWSASNNRPWCTVHLCTKFEECSFIGYRDIEGVPKFRNWARSPGHAHLGPISGLRARTTQDPRAHQIWRV